MGFISALFGLFMGQSVVVVPDGYAIDLERDPPRYAVPADRSNVIMVDIPTAHLLGDGKLMLRYDTESRGDIQHGTDVLILRAQWKFD